MNSQRQTTKKYDIIIDISSFFYKFVKHHFDILVTTVGSLEDLLEIVLYIIKVRHINGVEVLSSNDHKLISETMSDIEKTMVYDLANRLMYVGPMNVHRVGQAILDYRTDGGENYATLYASVEVRD